MGGLWNTGCEFILILENSKHLSPIRVGAFGGQIINGLDVALTVSPLGFESHLLVSHLVLECMMGIEIFSNGQNLHIDSDL